MVDRYKNLTDALLVLTKRSDVESMLNNFVLDLKEKKLTQRQIVDELRILLGEIRSNRVLNERAYHGATTGASVTAGNILDDIISQLESSN
jgi:hypothetical protein